MEFRGLIRGPRWAGIETAVRDAAHFCGLRIEVETEKRLLTQTTRFTLVGAPQQIQAFKGAMARTIERFNTDE